MKTLVLIVFGFSCFCSTNAYAWGGRGHHAICEAATQLVKDKQLQLFFSKRANVMGHLCNIPDIHWRDLGAIAEVGNATHYFEPDLVGVDIKDIPLEYASMSEMLKGKTHAELKSPIKSVSGEVGTIWCRADQFYRRAIESAKKMKNLSLPKERAEKQKYDFPFNVAGLDMITNMGVMGHFTGDVAQPLHNTHNYDGYQTGHGGIHNYYEEAVVAAIDSQLVAKIVKEASRKQNTYKFLNEPSTVGKMKGLATIAYSELNSVFKLDSVTKSSVFDKSGALVKKVPAERPAPELVVKKYEPLIISQMARSATLLAKLWEEIYEKSGKPELKSYESYKFPFQPEFVPPDYVN